jgi:hypothetical protein
MGERITDFPVTPGNLNGKSDYAYLFNVHEFNSVKLIYRLQEEGIRLKAASKPFRMQIAGKETYFDYGAVMVPVAEQFRSSDEIYAILQRWAPEAGITVYPVSSSFTSDSDLGGRNFRDMIQPKAAIIWGGGGNFSGVGDIWHLFDQRLQIPLTLLEYNRITPSVLSRYNTIILYGNYDFSPEVCNQLNTWHRAGGLFIAVGEGWRTVNKIGIATIELKESPAGNADDQNRTPVYLSYESRNESRRARIPGVILECRLDRSSPIGFGITGNTIPSFRESTNFYKSPSPYSTPVSYLEKPLLSGCIAPEMLSRVASTPAVITFPRVAFFADEPAYRAYWFGTMRMFVNALFFPL